MSLDTLFGAGMTPHPAESISPDVFNHDWDCIISITYDMTQFDPEDKYMRGCEYVDSSCIPVRGDIQTELYYHDLAATLASDEFEHIIDFDNVDESDVVPGVYRYVLGVRVSGNQWTSHEGVTEYDEEYYYDVISKQQYPEADEKLILGDLKRQEEEAQRMWAEQNIIEEIKLMISQKTITDPNILRLFDNGITPVQPWVVLP